MEESSACHWGWIFEHDPKPLAPQNLCPILERSRASPNTRKPCLLRRLAYSGKVP